jgi:hypothetical protein
MVIASSKYTKQQHYNCSTIDPKVVGHGWGRNVTAGLGAAPAGRVGFKRKQRQSLRRSLAMMRRASNRR